MKNSKPGGTARLAASAISSSTRATRRPASTASRTIAPCSPPSASSPPASAACWASPSRSPRPRYTGAPSSKAWSTAASRASSSSPRDDHPGLKAARKAVLPGARWQRCQFHLAQNAIHHAPNQAIRKAIGGELRAVWDAPAWERAGGA